jgi:DNA polymerase III alpha subunit
MSYAELQVTTHFSFLRGASSAEELFSAAALLGIKALGVTDRNSLAGMVRAHEASKVTSVRLVVGCRLDLQCGTSLLVYPTDRKSPTRGIALAAENLWRPRPLRANPDVSAKRSGALASACHGRFRG